jgi:hypothetical protein
MPNDNIKINLKNKKKTNNRYNNFVSEFTVWKVLLKQILPATAGKVTLGLEEIFVTSTYRTDGIYLYNSLQEAMIEMLLEVHLDNYLFFVLGLFRDTSNCP